MGFLVPSAEQIDGIAASTMARLQALGHSTLEEAKADVATILADEMASISNLETQLKVDLKEAHPQ